MQKNRLVIICNKYPYGLGETFLANEINYLSLNFSEITIISKNVNENDMRIIPDNVSVLRYNPKARFARNYICQSFFYLIFI